MNFSVFLLFLSSTDRRVIEKLLTKYEDSENVCALNCTQEPLFLGEVCQI